MGSVMEVQVALFCLITAVLSQQPEGLVEYHCADCVDGSNCIRHSGCMQNAHKCKPGYQLELESGNCTQCPGLGYACESCCYPENMYKCRGNGNRTCECASCVCWGNCNASFILAAQVALGAALTLAFLALGTLFWKTCQRRRNGPRRHFSSLLRERGSSLTSTQRFVLQRLRDRPPRYEDTNQIRLEKPPAYQEVGTDSAVPDIWSTSPPSYSEAPHSSTSNTVTEGNEPVQQANVSMVSDTRTEGKGENRLSDSCQLGRADNMRYTLHETRPTQPSATELHM